MTKGYVWSTAGALALAATVAIAQGQAGTSAHAEIKGTGITGKAELVERKAGTGQQLVEHRQRITGRTAACPDHQW